MKQPKPKVSEMMGNLTKKEAIKLAKGEIKEWQKFLKLLQDKNYDR